MDSESNLKINLDDYTPLFEGEEDELQIRGYQIDGELILDFDWSPDSKWTALEDDERFQEFAMGVIEKLCGTKMTRIEKDQLEFFHGLSHPEQSGASETAGCD